MTLGVRFAAFALLFASLPDEWEEFNALARDKDPKKRCDAVARIEGRMDLPMVKALFPLLADPHARVRKRAAEAVARARKPECFEFLRRAGLKHSSRPVRIHSAEALAWDVSPEGAAALLEALDEGDADLRAAAALALARSKSPDAPARLARAADEDSSGPARAAALESLAALDPDRARPLALKAMKSRTYQLRLTAVLVAPKLGAEAARDLFAAGLADTDWRVCVQAMESAAAARDASVIDGLIDLLARERGRLRLDAWHALCQLTDKDLGLDATAWKRWWEVNRAAFAVPAKGRAPGQVKAGESGSRFFSMPIFAERILLILDFSGSMKDPAPGGQGATKLEVAKRETIKTIQSFPATTYFNLILIGCEKDGTFQRDRKLWKKNLQAASPRAKSDAESFIERQGGGGQTNLWDMVEIAFEDEAVDSFFLYTDGAVNRGTFTATTDIFQDLERLNRYRKIMIHTVEMAAEKPNTEDNIRLLKGLAERTKGQYRLAE